MGKRKKQAATTVLCCAGIALLMMATSYSTPTSSLISEPVDTPLGSLSVQPTNPIPGVPYVSQETEFFCMYASTAIVFQYYGRDTSLSDILFGTGVGYSSLHADGSPYIIAGYVLSQSLNNLRFLAGLYALNFSVSYPVNNSQTEPNWQQYWSSVKQNISNGVPVITSVDWLDMPSIRDQKNLPEQVWEKVADSGHAIVIVGYNETNQTVCYNDPYAELWGQASYGYYAWMSTGELRTAVSDTPATKYLVIAFTNTSASWSKNEVFSKAHHRNLERLRGNFSAFGVSESNVSGAELGVRAVQAFQNDFSKGASHRLRTIFFYKLNGRLIKRYDNQLFLTFLRYRIQASSYQMLFATENEYDRIGIEKKYTANYLKNSGGSENITEGTLFDNEAKYWDSFSSSYDVFLKRGLLLSLPRALWLTRQMRTVLGEIQSTEEQILSS